MSVNSWGYQNSPGMVGPKLNESTSTTGARTPVCVYNVAKNLTSTALTTASGTCQAP